MGRNNLTGYLADGRLEMDNGFVEREIKNFAIGLKAWLLSDNHVGAEDGERLADLIVTRPTTR